MSAPAQSPEFAKAAEDAKKLSDDVTDQQKLRLYGLYKIGTTDPEKGYKSSERPSFLNPVGQAKHDAWGKATKEASTPEEAQKLYVGFVKQLEEEYN